MMEDSWVSAGLAASEEGFRLMELGSVFGF
jgi:hypothetical protein